MSLLHRQVVEREGGQRLGMPLPVGGRVCATSGWSILGRLVQFTAPVGQPRRVLAPSLVCWLVTGRHGKCYGVGERADEAGAACWAHVASAPLTHCFIIKLFTLGIDELPGPSLNSCR